MLSQRATPAAGHADLIPLDLARRGATGASWRALTAAAPPFLAPEFFVLARPLAPEGDAMVAAAWDGGQLIGAMPLLRDGDRLSSLRSDHSPSFDYCGSLAGLDAVWADLAARRWSTLTLRNIPDDSPLATHLPGLARAAGCPVVIRPAVRHPVFALPGFASRISPKFRSNVARCERKAGAELERLVAPSRADLDEAIAIEGMGWKGAAGTSIGADRRVAHLYRAASRLFGRRGQAALYFLRADGRRVAMMIAIEDATTLYALKIGFDPAASSWSPGHVLVWKVAGDAERRGLVRFDFVGKEDEWKRKWTDEVRRHVHVIVYQRSPRGLAAYALHEQIAPLAHRWVEDLRHPLPRRCQRADLIGVHTPIARARGRLARGLGIRSGLRRWRTPVAGLGAPSLLAEGDWVRVRDAASIRATLDARDRLRGLAFTAEQWATCGQVFRVRKVVRRLRDDRGRLRAVAGTVLLEGVTCAGAGTEPTGCGRHCPMMYRDEWLEPASRPHGEAHRAKRPHARIRNLDEIDAGLDLRGRRDGLTFMPEMAAYAGQRFAIAGKVTRVFELDRWIDTARPVYLLDGLGCSGAVLGDRGPCDRACTLLWHEDWLVIE